MGWRDRRRCPGHGGSSRHRALPALTTEKSRVFSNFINLIGSFLSLYKGNRCSPEQAMGWATCERDQVFLGIFRQVFEAYQDKLGCDEDIDFDDMIGRARDHVEAGSYKSHYRYILVDELQDISENRLALIQAIRAQVPGGRIFGVGDDWQSIFRFTGSDVGLITGFPNIVGATARTDLGQTFRFHQSLADFSSTFVMRNPEQLKKESRSEVSQDGSHAVTVIFVGFGWEHTERALRQALDNIRARHGGADGASVLVLGRYNLREQKNENDPSLTTSRFEGLRRLPEAEGLKLSYGTIHSAKGGEADFVIVVGNEAGVYGFPSEVVDDPVLKMVLSGKGAFPHAEERRLFYVAVTRAKQGVYLVSSSDNPSAFIQEILEDDYKPHLVTIGDNAERHVCPRCQGRTIRLKEGQYGEWWACLNYPFCPGKLTICSSCSAGVVAPTSTAADSSFECSGCGKGFVRCPVCKVAAMLQREGKFGPFLGCSGWRRDGTGCDNTQNLGSRGRRKRSTW